MPFKAQLTRGASDETQRFGIVYSFRTILSIFIIPCSIEAAYITFVTAETLPII